MEQKQKMQITSVIVPGIHRRKRVSSGTLLSLLESHRALLHTPARHLKITTIILGRLLYWLEGDGEHVEKQNEERVEEQNDHTFGRLFRLTLSSCVTKNSPSTPSTSTLEASKEGNFYGGAHHQDAGEEEREEHTAAKQVRLLRIRILQQIIRTQVLVLTRPRKE
jgi:hypothetical protein